MLISLWRQMQSQRNFPGSPSVPLKSHLQGYPYLCPTLTDGTEGFLLLNKLQPVTTREAPIGAQVVAAPETLEELVALPYTPAGRWQRS